MIFISNSSKIGFPALMCPELSARRRKVLERGSGKIAEQGSGENVILSAPGEAVLRWESCFPAPGIAVPWHRGKLVPGAGERLARSLQV